MNELLQAECGLQEQHRKRGHPKHQGGPHLLSESSQCSGGITIHDNSFLDEVVEAQKRSVKIVQSGVKSFTENSVDSVRV